MLGMLSFQVAVRVLSNRCCLIHSQGPLQFLSQTVAMVEDQGPPTGGTMTSLVTRSQVNKYLE